MKRVIEGKRYDTETADCVADISPRRYANDASNFHWEDTYLYRTKKGAWFIAGKGHAASRWATACGNGYGPGSGLQVVTAEDARLFLEQYGTVEDVEQYFTVEDA